MARGYLLDTAHLFGKFIRTHATTSVLVDRNDMKISVNCYLVDYLVDLFTNQVITSFLSSPVLDSNK
jgi:hypothetical protein